ncbi:MAG: hypothetical protein BIFFINMI_00688 [Phycisphaerae bacterium]|nr:hypothetical protein [Phycisphaerae bacterium]
MRLPGKKQTFWLLMGASLVAMWLPARYTYALRNLMDPMLAPLAGRPFRAGQDLREWAGDWTARPKDAKAFRSLKDENEELRRQLAQLGEEYRSRLNEIAEGQAFRKDLLLQQGRLIPSEVLLRDAVAWREGLLLDRPADFTNRKQWAVSRIFVDRGSSSDVSDDLWTVLPLDSDAGQAELFKCAMVGRVERVGQVTARIQLLSDTDSVLQVQIFRIQRGSEAAEWGRKCVLVGRGPGRMMVKELTRGQTPAGARSASGPPAEVGDLVFSDESTPNLGARLVVGRITAVRESTDSPGKFECDVTPAVNCDRLRRVWLVDPNVREPK